MDGVANAGNFAGLTAGADTFAGWVGAMKADFRKETGGNSAAAAPARPQPAAAARSAGG